MAEQKTSDGLDNAANKGVDGAMAKGVVDTANGEAAVGESAAATAAGASDAAAGTAVGGTPGTVLGAAVGLAVSVLANPLAKAIIVCMVFLALIFKSLPSMLFEEPIDMADNNGPIEVYQAFKEYALDAYDSEIESRKSEIESAFTRRVRNGEFDDYDDVVMTYEFIPSEEVFRSQLEDTAVLIIAMFELNTDEWREATFKDFRHAVNSVNFWHNTVTVIKVDEEAWTERDDGERIRYVHMTYNIYDKGIDQFRSMFNMDDDSDYIKAVEMAYNTRIFFGEVDDMPMGGVSSGGGTGSYVGGSTHSLIRQKLAELDEDQLLEYTGGCIIPLESYSYISSEFGLRNYARDPVHTGIDFAAAAGTPVYSAMDGIILMVRDTTPVAFGKHIVVYHGHDEQGQAITTMYAHFSSYGSYREGDPVRAGDTIGYVGQTGESTGDHLHFEYQIDGTAYNPRLILPL